MCHSVLSGGSRPRSLWQAPHDLAGCSDRHLVDELRARGYSFDPDSPFVRLLGDCHEEVRGGRPSPDPSRATTDLRFFEGQAVCYGPTGENLHGVDEWVDLESIADVATVIAVLIRRWGES